MKSIIVQIKTVYGVEQVYPACPDAVLFARIAGTKTLTTSTLDMVKGLGYRIDVASAIVYQR